MPINAWPNEDKPREKLLSNGEKSLTDAELIAIFLNSGIRGKTALDIARELLAEHGGLKSLLSASPTKLIQKRGVGLAKIASLKAAIELGKRFIRPTVSVGEILSNPKLTQQYLIHKLSDYPNEVFACLFLDTHYRLIRFEELFQGTVNEATVYPREIIRLGLALNAAKIILAHNHPSGNPQPSQADKELTYLVKQAAALVHIEVVDHVIVGRGEVYSFAEAG